MLLLVVAQIQSGQIHSQARQGDWDARKCIVGKIKGRQLGAILRIVPIGM